MGELGSPSTGALAGAQADVKAVLGNTRQEPKRDKALLHATSVLVARAEHLIAEDDEMHARELENIEGHLGPFMEKLSVLSGEYETAKAASEREWVAKLAGRSATVTQAVVDAEFNKRALVNMIKEYEQSAHKIMIEGIEARRLAEKQFASQMLSTCRGEFQNVVAAMRQEDRKKLAYQVRYHALLSLCGADRHTICTACREQEPTPRLPHRDDSGEVSRPASTAGGS